MRKLLGMLVLMVLGSGCGAELQDAYDAHESALHATKAGAAIIDTAQAIGLLPKYTCGVPAREEYAELVPALSGNLGSCANVSRGGTDGINDEVDVRFAQEGCDLFGAKWTGGMVATVSGGDDRSELDLDLHGVAINGHPVDAKLGRVTCGDLDTWSLAVTTRVPASAHTKELDLGFHGTVVDRPGIPFLGADYLILDGPADVVYGGKHVQVVFHEVWWEAGLDLPRRGELELVQPNGSKVAVKFGESDHEMLVSVDGGRFAPVPVP